MTMLTAATVATQRTAPQPITVESVGEPLAISCLARLLLQLHHQPPLRLVHERADEQPSDHLPAIVEGPR